MFGFENEEMIAAVNTIYAIAWRSLKKIQEFNGVWTRDLAIPVRCSTNWAMKSLPMEKHPIPMVLLVNMHLIKET